LIFLGIKKNRKRNGSSDALSDFAAHGIIRTATTAFWESYLNDNPSVRGWLQTGGLERAIAAHASFEFKTVNRGGNSSWT
jgi:hypothetical protein